VGFALVEPESDTQVAGGTVSGSLLEMFDLEDRFVSRLRETLRLEGRPADSGRQPRPRDPAAAERFGQALAYMRRFDHEASVDGAVTLLERLLETEGESATVHAALARAYLRKSVLAKQRVFESKAATSCEHAARLDPGAAEVMLAAADLHLVRGRHDQALAELERTLSIAPDLLDAHLLRARALKSAGQIGEAEEACRRAITLAPDDWRGYHEFGLLLFDVGRYSEALNVWRRVIQIVPDHASAHRNLGSALHHLDRDEEAVAALRRAIDIRPHAMAFSNLGAVLFYLERYEESVAALEKAVALNSSEPLAWGNLGNACLHIPGREPRMREALERAIGLLRERLDQGSGDGEDWARLSGWLVNLGRHEEAERALRAGLERSPENVHCMVEAGQTLIKLGRPTEGLIWFRRAVESGYGAQWLRRHPELKFLTGNPEFESILALPSRNRSHT
jgi:tetratricopeptide (TPR) repeat protein